MPERRAPGLKGRHWLRSLGSTGLIVVNDHSVINGIPDLDAELVDSATAVDFTVDSGQEEAEGARQILDCARYLGEKGSDPFFWIPDES